MIIKKIAILSTVFIFCIALQSWADTTGTLDATFYEGSIIEMNRIEERPQLDRSYRNDEEVSESAFFERPEVKKKFRLTESLEKLFSIYKFAEPSWKYKFLDSHEGKETKFQNLKYGPSILNLNSHPNRDPEESGARVTFELLQSKLKKTEVFILFNLSFNPKTELIFMEMSITPSSDRGVSFLIPF